MYNLDYIVNFPTRINDYTETTIDNIFLDRSKNENFIIEPYYNGLSDHDAQMLKLYIPSYTSFKPGLARTGRKYDDSSLSDFKMKLSYENWENVFNSTSDNDVNVIFNNFFNMYLRIFCGSFPLHKFLVRNKCKGWLPKGILILCRHKKDLYLLCRMSNNIVLKSFYKKYCKILTSTLQLAKKLHYNKLISQSENKTKTAWSIIKSLTNKRADSSEEPMLNIEGKLIKNPQILSETINDYFSNIVEESVNKIIKQDNNDLSKHSYKQYLVNAFKQPFAPIKLKSVTESEIYEINKILKWKTSYGYDEVPSWIVKLSMPFISSPLISICNKMLSTDTFPTWLKFSQVFPLFKKGNKTEMSDYRPVSLLTSFSKIFEKVIYNRLLQHTKENNIIDTDHYGFKNNSSTELAIFKLINQILSHIKNKSLVCGIFCDLKKAFDTVNHDILISKLEYYGIIVRTNKLIKSYLSKRYQRVTIKTSHVSNWELVKHGVP